MDGIEKSKGYIRGNYYTIVVYRLCIAFLFLWLSRVMFYFFNLHYFEHLLTNDVLKLFFFGIRFDLSTLFTLNTVFIVMMTIPLPFRRLRVYRTVADLFFFIPNLAGISLNLADIVYFRFTQKRMTGDIFDFVVNDVPMDTLLPQFIRDFWPYFLITLFLAIVCIVLVKMVSFSKRRFTDGLLTYYQMQVISFILSLAVTIIGIRGGFQLKPIKVITAAKYTQSRNVPILLNTPFTIIKTIDQQSVNFVQHFDENEIDEIYSPEHNSDKLHTLGNDSLFQQKNIVLIIMESLSSEHIGAFNRHLEHYQGFTPFLDSLMQHSLVFNGFANAKQSIEGIPAIVASLPGLMDRSFINSPYSGNAMNSLASLLGEKGYHTSFYHGGTNGTMDFDRFADLVGFDNYFGREEYNNDDDFDGRWGIFDEPFFQYFARHLAKTPQPFLSVLFSLSAHHPYTIPQEHTGKFMKGNLEIQEAIMYSDFALRRFFKTASKMPWFKNTLFVITADHTSEADLPEYKTRFGMFRIPILFFDPNKNLPATINKVTSQVDIMPSLLSLLNFDAPFISFGQNLFDESQQSFAVTHLNGIYQIIQEDYVLEFDGVESLALYNVNEDIFMKNNLLFTESEKVNTMERLLKAYIQQYYTRLKLNRMTAE
ncbi:MAG: sulfatase-like hydrolase/transferase [Bacteroidales bacterium]|nr:sulfatase-like hydrolase/transferase [Bacteroidales bacterium]